uniref:RNA-directed RNA polymerase n=1 Tax=Panagrolaimus sp. ES5 TaxID=591445 RepID=A0AC34GWZ1_9BILA
MFAVACRLVFNDFPETYIDEFMKVLNNVDFQTVKEVTTQASVTMNSDLSEKNTEVQFSFKLKAASEGRKLDKAETYKQTCLAFCELSTTCETIRRDFCRQGLNNSAIVTMNILSENIYPQHFELQNVFSMKKLLFGSIIERRNFAPTYYFDEPKNDQNEHEIFEQYLDGQRDLQNIESNMLICFEHDRECLTVCFPDIVQNWVNNGNDRSPKRVVDIRVSYSSIRRIIATMSTDENGEIKVAFTFQLHYPPIIQVFEKSTETITGGSRTKFRPSNRCLTWNRNLDIQNAVSKSSCVVADCHFVDSRQLLDCLDRLRKSNNFGIEFRNLYRKKCLNIKSYERNNFMNLNNLPSDYSKLKDQKYFPLVYAVQALITRGGELYDYFFRPEYFTFYNFLNTVIEHFDADLQRDPEAKISKTVSTLENMLLEVDKAKDIIEPLNFFLKLYNDPGLRALTDITDSEGYMRVRKVIVTPTRKIFVNPELIMGNRFLRKHGTEKMVRILFRDDDGTKLSFFNSRNVAFRCVKNALEQGLYIAGKKYVFIGSSCSQLRDNGGKFKIESVPKMMARIGQCFTQSKLSRVPIDRNKYSVIHDFEGGKNSQLKAYCFSDGVGAISAAFAARISTDLRFNGSVPSCFQFRFRGFKGVLSISTELDKILDWHQENGISSEKPCLEMQLRLSQLKFKGPREEYIEIVKHSAPSAVSLNKPMLNILDQVSQKQSAESHDRIIKRVNCLLNRHINRIMGSLNNEKDALFSIAEFPKLILSDRLNDFCLTQEPFFRSLLRAWAKFMLNKLTKKMRISIPPSLGRSMFGIVDETGLLQSGTVFIRYTVDCYDKLSQAVADKRIYKGKVLITKNPAVVGGDVRVFEAVDCVALRHLSDVVVFPRYGPRPHPDEMAGSDLDGDEYTVIWDPDLLIDYNQPAFDYSLGPSKDEIKSLENEEELQQKMIEFFVEYISQDSIGLLANAHLANSDLYGIDTEHCNNIALKHNAAVDFPKTGIAPPPLRRRWNEEGEPPERVERWPDFMGKKQRLSYRSQNLMGELYRAVEDIETVLNNAEAVSQIEGKLELDDAFIIDEGYTIDSQNLDENFAFVEAQYSRYCFELQTLLETYGIGTEGELFSGHFSKVKGKITDSGGDNDDLSLYNTTGVVSQRLEELFVSFRTQFFDYFPGGRNYLETAERVRINFQSAAILGQVCTRPNKQMCDVAVIFYNLAYTNKSTRFLSFAWLVWDILAYVKKQYIIDHNIKLPVDPLGVRLSDHIHAVINSADNVIKKRVGEIVNMINYGSKEWKPINGYCKSHAGLLDLLVFLGLWADKHALKVDLLKFYSLVICLSNGTIYPDIDDFTPWLEPVDFISSSSVIDLNGKVGGIGRIMVVLFSALSSNKLQTCEEIEVNLDQNRYGLNKNELVAIRDAALTSYYHLSLTDTQNVLPQESSTDSSFSPVIEGPPCVIEIPASLVHKSLDALRKRAKLFGCVHVASRVVSKYNNQNSRICLVAKGTLQQIRAFYDSIAVIPKDLPSARAQYDDMTAQVYEKLFSPI